MSLKPLLDKLEPFAMMEEGGTQKAFIAMRVLGTKAESDTATAAALAQQPGGIKLLMQTALLHPEPQMRVGATSILATCVGQGDKAFITQCLDQGGASLPAALVRLCHEEDRKVKSEEREEAVDPDLPARRHAVKCLASLLTACDPEAALRALSGEWPGVAGTPFSLLANSDASIRQDAAVLMSELLCAEGTDEVPPPGSVGITAEQRKKRAALISAYAVDEPAKAAAAFAKALGDEDEAVRVPTAEAMRALQASAGAAFTEELVKEGALAEAG